MVIGGLVATFSFWGSIWAETVVVFKGHKGLIPRLLIWKGADVVATEWQLTPMGLACMVGWAIAVVSEGLTTLELVWMGVVDGATSWVLAWLGVFDADHEGLTPFGSVWMGTVDVLEAHIGLIPWRLVWLEVVVSVTDHKWLIPWGLAWMGVLDAFTAHGGLTSTTSL